MPPELTTAPISTIECMRKMSLYDVPPRPVAGASTFDYVCVICKVIIFKTTCL
ncbi:hypothetical protein J6590_089236 [Homalodisca vitripennis]|nr:hypothetical protein J6590_089236 [Homalodisca vitripennis]